MTDAGHVRNTLSALRALGTRITTEGQTFVVQGDEYAPSAANVSVGSSAHHLVIHDRLVSLATAPVTVTVTGQKYFQRRPISPLLAALEGLGVQLLAHNGCPPIQVSPRRPSGGRVSIQGTLSQWISGLLMLAPHATGPSVIEVEGELNERTYIDLTIAMMTRSEEADHPEGDLLDIVAQMGVPMTRDPSSGYVRVRHDGLRLAPVHADCRLVPDMLPVLSVLGTVADGTSRLDNIAHVRLKESDRVSAMLQLNRMGGRLEVRGDG